MRVAYINGEWLDRDQRQARIEILTERARKLKALYDAGKTSEYHIDTLLADKVELTRLRRIHRAEYDMLYFMHEYFSEECNPANPDNLIPAGVTLASAAGFHRTLCALLDEITTGKQRTNVAWSVGRGHAKTAYLSNGFLCHQIVYRLRRYIVEVSETTEVAGDFISWSRNQLKYNDKLREDFGELMYAQRSKNAVDNYTEFVTINGTKVEAKGIGTQMRGLRHGNTRPDLFLLDDLESKNNTNTPELIEKSKAWFREEMLPALSREGICVYMGTIVAYESLLDYVIKQRRDFVSRKFPAILSWAEREDLWQRWREIYRSDDAEAGAKADRFFEDNREELLRGTKTLWPQMFSYLDLMKLREENGVKAFNQEYLGNPTDEERQIFKPEDMTFFLESDLQNKNLDYICGIDFAMGKEKGDYSAIITLGRNKDTGICYVIDAYIERVHPDVLLSVAVEKALKYQYEIMSVEAQMAQEWWADKLAEKLGEKGFPYHTRLKQIKQRTRKALRIEALLPDIQSGKIRFQKHQRLLFDMLEMYPMHKHDDGPDALAQAFSAAKDKRRTITTSAKRLR
jgi:predicted phage terminase large subunit-like protein